MTHKEIIVFGSEGTAIELVEFLKGYKKNEFRAVHKIFITKNIEDNLQFLELLKKKIKLYYIFGVIDFTWRSICLDQLKDKDLEPYTFIHPKAFVSTSASIGKGVYIGPNSTIAPFATIEDHALININASIGHHSIIEKHTIVLPGARISGNVHVREKSLVGSNSVIFQGIKIGKNTSIDAMVYIKKDIEDNMIVFGAKSKAIKKIGYK